jgi:hypothetical protein
MICSFKCYLSSVQPVYERKHVLIFYACTVRHIELLLTAVTCSRLIPCAKIWSHFRGEPLQPYTLEVYSIGSQTGFSLCKEGFHYIGTTYGSTYILWNQNFSCSTQLLSSSHTIFS